MGAVGAGEPGQRARRPADGVRTVRGPGVRLQQGGCDPLAGCGVSGKRVPRHGALRAPVRRPAARSARQHEPLLHGGERLHQHRRQGRSSPATQAQRDRAVCRSARGESRRGRRGAGEAPAAEVLRQRRQRPGQKRGRSLVLAGMSQPPEVHALAYTLNAALGNVGQTVVFLEPAEARAEIQIDGLKQLVGEMNGGQVETLLILGANPVFDAPADLNFAEAIRKVTFRVHHGLYADETADYCQWHIPAAHYLESWSDVRSFDGLASIVQPLIAPLYSGHTAHEVIAAFTDNPEVNPYEAVRAYWRRQNPGGNFEQAWGKWHHDGFIPNTRSKPAQVQAKGGVVRVPESAANTLELEFRHDPSIYDGRFANNGWLMELPRPMTKITWDNAALMSPTTAERLGVSNEDEIEIEANGRKLRLPSFMVPGHASDAITVHLGYGRRIAGRVA